MPQTVQEFLAGAADKAAADLEAALLRLPADRRDWVPMGAARTALDMVAECAILNGGVADIIEKRAGPTDFNLDALQRAKEELARDEDALRSLLQENTAKVAAVIRTVPDADLGREIHMPWGPMTLIQILSYPYWNLSYHEGQINYIASLLG